MEQKEQTVDRLIEVLQEREVLTDRDATALKEDFKRHEAPYFEDFLLEEEIVEKEDLLAALQEMYGVPAVDVVGEVFDHNLVTMFPKDVLLRNCTLPYRRDENVLFVITNDPEDDEREVTLREYVSYDIEFFVGIPSHIDLTIKEFYQDSLYQEDPENIIDEAEVDEEKDREEDIERYRDQED